jgi:hypothetical protein
MMEALSSSETSFLRRATRRNIPEDATLHSHRLENVKSYMNEKLAAVQTTDSSSRRRGRLALKQRDFQMKEKDIRSWGPEAARTPRWNCELTVGRNLT